MDKEAIFTESHAKALDDQDPLRKFRDDFIFPSRSSLAATSISGSSNSACNSKDRSIYLCGNSSACNRLSPANISNNTSTPGLRKAYLAISRKSTIPLWHHGCMSTKMSEMIWPRLSAP